MDAKVKYEL